MIATDSSKREAARAGSVTTGELGAVEEFSGSSACRATSIVISLPLRARSGPAARNGPLNQPARKHHGCVRHHSMWDVLLPPPHGSHRRNDLGNVGWCVLR